MEKLDTFYFGSWNTVSDITMVHWILLHEHWDFAHQNPTIHNCDPSPAQVIWIPKMHTNGEALLQSDSSDLYYMPRLK